MRKRRILANKLTIMVCAVLLAVSAFFYAPMEVEASSYLESNDYTLSSSCNSYMNSSFSYFRSGDVPITFDFVDDLDSNTDYLIKYSGSLSLFLSSVSGATLKPNFSQIDLILKCTGKSVGLITKHSATSSNPYESTFSGSFFYDHNSSGKFSYNLACVMPFTGVADVYIDSNFELNIVEVIPLSGSDSQSYQQGYNAGYSAGEEAGESNGYSSGYSDGYEAGEQSGYDSGFQAGSDSVDTQSYYDAGYSAGYDAGYLEGYETGYDEGYDAGWSAYEAQMDKWGADTTVYPILIASGSRSRVAFEHLLGEDYCFPFDYHCFSNWYGLDNFNVDANHTYKFEFWYDSISEYDDDWVEYSDLQLFANIGGCKYPLILLKSGEDKKISIYISGDRMSDSMSFEAVFYGVCNLKADSHVGLIQLVINNLNVAYYDMGPIGDTQNHIANQTDQLTNGYDDSKGNQVNSDLSTGLNDYETAENSLFATATTGMKDFTFFDFESVPAMITGMSFIGSIMGSWFNQAGGASGVGIVLSILFSVILVAMVLGLYRWYQSRGGKN